MSRRGCFASMGLATAILGCLSLACDCDEDAACIDSFELTLLRASGLAWPEDEYTVEFVTNDAVLQASCVVAADARASCEARAPLRLRFEAEGGELRELRATYEGLPQELHVRLSAKNQPLFSQSFTPSYERVCGCRVDQRELEIRWPEF